MIQLVNYDRLTSASRPALANGGQGSVRTNETGIKDRCFKDLRCIDEIRSSAAFLGIQAIYAGGFPSSTVLLPIAGASRSQERNRLKCNPAFASSGAREQ